MPTPLVICDNLVKIYKIPEGDIEVVALQGLDLEVPSGEFLVIVGQSGSGKTTLLNILAGLDNPTTGRVLLIGQDLQTLSEAERARLRRESIGILFQNAHLFPLLTAQENVEALLRLSNTPPDQRRERARAALDRVGLTPRAHHRGLELSGGEQQRVALARALVHYPRVLLADEPTGNLDTRTGRDIIALLRATAHENGIGLLVATHDSSVISAADRVQTLHDGQIIN